MDKMVAIAQFTYPADAQILISLLKSEGIDCYLRNELTARLLYGYADVGGVYLEILEKDLPEALRIMKNGGYELPSGNVGWASDLKKFMDKLPLFKGQKLEKQLLGWIIVLALLLAVVFYTVAFFMYE